VVGISLWEDELCDPHALGKKQEFLEKKQASLENDIEDLSEAGEALLRQLEEELNAKKEDVPSDSDETIDALEELVNQLVHGSSFSAGRLALYAQN